MTDLIQK